MADSSLLESDPQTEKLPPALDDLTHERVLESLTSLKGSPEAALELWNQCCARADAPSRPTTFEQLDRIAKELTSLGGPLALVGSSLAIRANTYRLLRQTQRLEAFLKKDQEQDLG